MDLQPIPPTVPERTGTKDAAAQEVLPQMDKMRVERAGSQRWL
ncbi:MAG: hypothetical protein M5R42_01850 [Rhodocyclaceae bacterium]|nr:hypothetical protein [Rhodocyclaceae bacterium]